MSDNAHNVVPWWRSFAIRFVALYTTVSVSLILVAVLGLYAREKEGVEGKFGLALESIASTAAPFIRGEDIDAVRDNADAKSEAFQRTRAILERIRSENELGEDQIYVLRRSGATTMRRYQFVVMLQAATFVGDTYRPPPPVFESYSWVEDQRDTVRTHLYSDQHGTFISGIAPILRQDGSVAGLLQVDYGVSTYLAEVRRHEEILIAGVGVLALLFVLLGVWMHRVLRNNVEALVAGTDAIMRENYDYVVNARSRDEFGRVAGALNQAIRKLKERFEMLKFLPRHTARMIEDAANTGGVQRSHARRVRVTVFESDIRGFTRLSEALPAETVVQMLNDYIRIQAEIIEAAGGSIDKFMGDAVLAIFEGEAMERRAFECALAIQSAVSGLNAAAKFEYPVQIGIGLTAGEVVMGNMGSDRRMEYTVIGSTVNLAARLCSLAIGGQIILSKDLRERLGETDGVPLSPPEEVRVKGFESAVVCYRAHAS